MLACPPRPRTAIEQVLERVLTGITWTGELRFVLALGR
jgi:hypothetical protein